LLSGSSRERGATEVAIKSPHNLPSDPPRRPRKKTHCHALKWKNPSSPSSAAPSTQISAALRMGVSEIYADFEDIRRLQGRRRQSRAQSRLSRRTPARRADFPRHARASRKRASRVFFKLIENAQPRRRPDPQPRRARLFSFVNAAPHRRFSLNVANPRPPNCSWRKASNVLTVSYDLNAGQVLRSSPAPRPPALFEITLHQQHPDVP